MLSRKLIGSGGEVDPLFEDVMFLARFDGPAGVVTASQVRDFSRHRRVAASVGAGTRFDDGYRNQALGLDVSSDRAEFSDDADLRFGTGKFTIEVIVKRGATSGTQSILSKGVNNSSGYDLRFNGDSVEFRYGASSVVAVTGPSVPPPTNTSDGDVWYYIRVWRDDASNLINVNVIHLTGAWSSFTGGVGASSASSVGYNFNQTNPLYIGVSRNQSNPIPSTGLIDEIRFTSADRYPPFTFDYTSLSRPFPGK